MVSVNCPKYLKMTLTELIREVWQTGKERIRNPILGAFIFSWCAINYEVLIVLFSSIEPIAKIYFIKQYTTWYGTTIVPFGVALFLRVIIGYMSWLQEIALKKANAGRSELSTQIDLLQYERRSLKAEKENLIDRLRTGEDKVAELEGEIALLKVEKSGFSDEIESQKKVHHDLKGQILRLEDKVDELTEDKDSILADYYSTLSKLSGIPITEEQMPTIDNNYEIVRYILSSTDSRTRKVLNKLKNLENPDEDLDVTLANELDKAGLKKEILSKVDYVNGTKYKLDSAGKSLYYALHAGDFNPGFRPSLY